MQEEPSNISTNIFGGKEMLLPNLVLNKFYVQMLILICFIR
jgi:hypothetical protein